jgi:LPXTG-motif cell wall-anchored protein
MDKSMHRVTRMVICGAVAAFAIVPLLASSASAVDGGAGGVCVFRVLPNPVSGFPAQVQVEGTAPAGSTVTAYSGATPLASTVTNGSGSFATGNFSLGGATNVTANFTVVDGNGYATGCADPSSLTVVRVEAATASQQQAQALAFTGSNNTSSFALIGVTALIVGIVLTVGARRRSRLSA